MNLFHKTGWLAVLALLLCALASCKEAEEEETTSGSMTGTITFEVPYYVLKGETVTMTASGILYPEDVQYRWLVSGVWSDSLSMASVTVRFPDSLGVFTVVANAYASGYYVSSNSVDVTTIDTTWNTSLTGLSRSDQVVVDGRDGTPYHYVTIGGLDWFSQNLAYQVKNTIGVPFKASPVTQRFFGTFYTWNEAVSSQVCPEGWRVPDQKDWEALGAAMNGGKALPFVDNWAGLGEKASADAKLNDSRMWPYSPDNTHTNVFGWNALPLGHTFGDGSTFNGINAFGYWWCATEKDADNGYFRYIWYDNGDFPMSYTGKNDMRANVRCVRTHPQS